MMISKTASLWVAALLILSISLWSCTTAQSDRAADCCLTTSDKRIPQRVVTSFTLQTGDGVCRIPATIFVTRRGLKLCAPFPSASNWVSELIQHVLRGQKNPPTHRGKKHRKQPK